MADSLSLTVSLRLWSEDNHAVDFPDLTGDRWHKEPPQPYWTNIFRWLHIHFYDVACAVSFHPVMVWFKICWCNRVNSVTPCFTTDDLLGAQRAHFPFCPGTVSAWVLPEESLFFSYTGRLITVLDATLPLLGPISKSIRKENRRQWIMEQRNKAAPVYAIWTCASLRVRQSERKWVNDPCESFRPEKKHTVENANRFENSWLSATQLRITAVIFPAQGNSKENSVFHGKLLTQQIH